jgi:hypothetical protein
LIQNKKPGILEGADCASRVAGGEKTKQAIVQERLFDGKVLGGFIQLRFGLVATGISVFC